MSYDVSIVLFGRPTADFHECLRSLCRQSMPPRRVWVLWSASERSDGPVTTSRIDLENAPWMEHGSVNLICRPDNIGYGGGHNYLSSLAFADGADSLLILNPDVSIPQGQVENLLNSVASQQDKSQLTLHAPRLTLMSPGGGDSGRSDSEGIAWTHNRRHFDSNQGEFPTQVEGVRRTMGLSGAALYITKNAWATLIEHYGFVFDPAFLAYREDAELGLRVRRGGGVNMLHMSSVFLHRRGSLNYERGNELQRLLGVKNRFLLQRLLGSSAPGITSASVLRDAMVLVGVLTSERSSFSGVKEAWRIRRSLKNRGRRTHGTF